MANITQEQFTELVKNAPKDTSASEIMVGLKKRGHILEGIEVPGEKGFFDFVAQDLTRGTEGEGNIFKELFRSTIGSRGLAGVFQLPGRVAETALRSSQQRELAETRAQGQELAGQAIQRAQQFPEGSERRGALEAAAQRNIQGGLELRSQEEALDERQLSPQRAIGTTGNALLTVGALGKNVLAGPFYQQVLKSAGIGFGFATAGALADKERLPTAGEVISGTIVSAAIPGAGRVAGGLLTKVKEAPRAVSNFFFGPKGTSGFSARFKDPQGVERFLTTARRETGGEKVESIVSLFSKGVQSVRDGAVKVFKEAEEKIVQKIFPTASTKTALQKTIRDFIDEESLTNRAIEGSGLNDTEARVVQKVVRLVRQNKDFSTKGLLTLRRRIDNLFRGTETTRQSDALISQLRNQVNDLIGSADSAFRTASKQFSETRRLLDQLRINIQGTSKLNVDQTANRLFRIAKDLDDPFRNEGAERLLVELEKRTGIPFLDTLRALATAQNLSPQQSQGLRAGVVRELTRILEVNLSNVVGVAGKVNQQLQGRIPSLPLLPGTKEALQKGTYVGIMEEFARLLRKD